MKTHCPHCGSHLSFVQDAFCSDCSGALDEEPAGDETEPQSPSLQPTKSIISAKDDQRFEDLTVANHSKSRILRNFAGYLPLAFVSVFLYFVFGAIAMSWLLEDRLKDQHVKPVALSIAGGTAIIGGFLYVRFFVNRLSHTRLSLQGNTFLVRGQTSKGLVERHYVLHEIASVSLGEPLNVVEQIMDRLRQAGVPKMGNVQMLKDLKAGRLVIVERSGGKEAFHFVDKVFERDSLLQLLIELLRRGVTVGLSD